MGLQFLVGSSGTGKTTYMFDEMIKASMVEGHNPIFYLLPEQSNLAAEQEMVMRHPFGGTMDISIVSFSRLAFMVFDELGVSTRDILDDYGKSMLIMSVLSSVKEELSYYKNIVNKKGFVDEVNSILSEFYQYQITEETLDKALATVDVNKSLYYKLKDLKVILHSFHEALSSNYMIAEQMLSMLKEVAADSQLLRNATIYFDGFTGFTPVQYGVIEELMRLGCDLNFSMTVDADVIGDNTYGENQLFSFCKNTYHKLYYLAEKNQITILPNIRFDENFRLKNRADLEYFKNHMFRIPCTPYTAACENISMFSASSAENEIAYIARYIKQQVMENGYEYKDFAIVGNEIASQSNLWKQYMERMEIPYFIDHNEPFEHNPFVDVVWMLFEMYRTDFSYPAVFSFLKSGFLDIPMEQIYELENYALKYGVRGYSWWDKPFRGGVKGLKAINETRDNFMQHLSELSEVFQLKKSVTRNYIEALYNFMVKNNMREKLNMQSINFEKQGDLRQADAYRQIYEKWLLVLDKTVDLLGEEQIERDTIAQLLVTGISELKLGLIPSTLDQVMIGDLERTRLHDVKILFIVGMNDGIMPKLDSNKGILLDKDRSVLKDLDISLAPDQTEELFIQQYYFYMQATQAKERIVMSYYTADKKGAEIKPSYYLNRFRSMFPDCRIESMDTDLATVIPYTAGELAAAFSWQVMNEKLLDSSIYHMMEKYCPEELQNVLQGYIYHNEPDSLTIDRVKDLYGTDMVNSVSKLERFTSCEYAFFLQYGLGIYKRDEFKVESNNIGSILHRVMEVFFSKVKDEKIILSELDTDTRDAMVEAITIEAAKEENDTIFESSFRKKHQLDVLIRIAKRSIANLCFHLEKGDMVPTYFEKKFSPEDKLEYTSMQLEHDVNMNLRGIVDRIDLKETEDAIYFKIIDYKSGSKDVDFAHVYEGKQLQLAVYMSVIKEMLEKNYPDKKIIPTGMYYYQLQDKVIDKSSTEDIEVTRMKENRLTGLVNEDETCRILMDQKTGEVTRVRYKNDGEPHANVTCLVSSEELEQISKFVKNKITEIGNQIVNGNIHMNPEKGDKTGPCQYCDYRSICRFEPGVGGNQYSTHTDLDKQEIRNCVLGYEEEAE